MNNQPCLAPVLASLTLFLLPMTPAEAQSPFFQAVTNLNPVAYWPLQETVQPPAADVEANIGSLGAVGNAYYSSTNVYRGQLGAPADYNDPYVYCNGNNGAFLAVPTTDPRTTVPAGPFTVEAWINPANVSAGNVAIVSQAGVNPGGLNNGTFRGGWVLSQNYYAYQDRAFQRGWSFHVYNGQGAGNGQPQGGGEAGIPYNFNTGTWYYLVGVFDGTNCTLYLGANGVIVSSTNAGYTIPMTGSYVPDYWDPLCIGCGRGLNANRFTGGIDEVAIYTNALTPAQVQAHFYAAGSSYAATVSGDNPYMWWRMDQANYTPPDVSAYPVAGNVGSDAGLDGLYLSGTTPGVAGPALPGMGSPSYACAFNGIGTDSTNLVGIATNGIVYATNVLNSGVLVTNINDALINAMSNSLSLVCWFKGNPADNRFQGIFGAGDRNWRLAMGNGGNAGKIQFNPASGGDLVSPAVFNDGNWHLAAAVSQAGTNSAGAFVATNYLYVDGELMFTASNTPTNGWPGLIGGLASVTNILIGGSPDYTVSGNGNGYRQRFFSGSLAHVAYFSNALTAAQIVNLYTNATGGALPAPIITSQPYPWPAVRTFIGGAGTYLFEAVVAAGNSPLAYQWYYNSVSNYAGATALVNDGVHYQNSQTAQMTLTNIVAGDSGYYFCTVNDPFGGAVTSAIVNVQIVIAPQITAQSPAGPFTLFAGQNPTLSVTALGQTNLVYQWFTNGVADTTAGTGASYTLPGAQAQSGETFYCVVTNNYGSATSAVATLTLQPLPANVANSAYATNILALNPTVYFPMHESGPAAPGDTEINYGTLGAVANGTYADWNVNNGAPDNQVILHNVGGATVGDVGGGTGFNFNGTTNSYLLVPRTSSGTTLRPPFTIEAWVKGVGPGFGDIVSQDGTKLNTGNANNTYGIRLSWGGNIQVYVGSYPGPAASSTLSYYQWHHVALTCDTNNAATNYSLYVDGNNVSTKTGSGFIPDTWDPLTIGNGLWNASGVTRAATNLYIDEVAIYSTNLDSTTLSQHYSDGLYGAPGQYFADVTNLQPVMYYRMQAPIYTRPDQSTWPVMTNYGTAAVNGVYWPGLAPGSVAGPNNGAGLFASTLSGSGAAPMNGMSSFASAFAPNVFNVIGAQTPLSFSLWFRGHPSDARYQCLVSQGTGWQLNQQANGTLQFYLGSTYVNTTNVVNDGNWHQVVVTYSTNVGNIYVDGVLNGSGTSPALTNPAPDLVDSVGIGADMRYIGANQATGAGRQYAGDLCEFAFWNGTALTPSQVATLYQSSGMAPIITNQPIAAAVNARTVFTNFVGAYGPGPLTYQWYRDGQPLPINGQTNLTIGATNAALIIDPVKSSDASADYYAVVSNPYGSTTSSIVSLTVFSEPAFTFEPINVTLTNNILLFAGAMPTFKVASVGAQPTYYQWFTNGVAASANSPALTNFSFSVLPGLTSFYCQASNFVGATTTTPIGVTVLDAPTAPYPQAVMANQPIGYWRLDEPDDGTQGADGNAGVISHDYWGGQNGIYTNTGLGGYYSFLGTPPPYSPLDTSTNPAGFGLALADSDAYGIQGVDFGAPANASAAFSVEAWVDGPAQGKDAGIVSKGYGGGGEQFDLDTGGPGHTFRFFVRDASGATHGVNSSIQPGDVWHHLVGVCDEPNGTVTLFVDGVVAGTAAITPGSGILASSRAMLIGSRPSGAATANDNQFVGFIKEVAVYNYALSASQVQAQYAATGVPPNFTLLPPTNMIANGYGTLTIPAGAVGTPPIGFTWQDMNAGTNVAAFVTNGPSLDATLAVGNVPLTWNNDTLQLTVTNAYGATNVFVTLTVYTNAPVITMDLPPQVTVVSGRSYTYSPALIGPEPYGYQWFANGTPLAGQTGAFLSLVAGVPGSSTNFFVVVTNAFGAVTSSVSLFTSLATNSYAGAVMNLNPAGYWPLQETVPPAPATIETNYGTLGALGTAYYAGTNAAAPGVLGGNVSFGQNGALNNIGDFDTAAGFVGGNNLNETNSYLFVPIRTPALALNGPVTYECWFNSSSGGFADLMGNGGIDGDGSGNWSGIRLSYNRGTSVQAFWYNGVGSSLLSLDSGANTITMGQWYYAALTYDGTNVTLYVNGAQTAASVTNVAPNYWTPLSIGCGRWDGQHETRAYGGLIDEVAVYTNALTPTQIMNHYLAGTTSGSNYVATITNDRPLLYYRMDGVYTNPSPAAYPLAVNYGSVPVNGAYQPGVTPGGVSGPPISTLSNVVAAPINGVFSCVDAGYDSAFNITGTNAFSAAIWFRGNPWDNRTQCIMGQGNNWAMNVDGTTGRIVWNTYNGGQVTSSTVLNDGRWHFVAGVDDGRTNYLYVDGSLNAMGALASTNGLGGAPNVNLYLGGNAAYTYPQSGGAGTRHFAGALAQAVFFTNALTAAQVQQLYNAAFSSGAPVIVTNVVSPFLVMPGGTVANSVSVIGQEPLAYQWQFNGVNLFDNGHVFGSLTNVLTIVNAVTNDAGNYQVIITNSLGSVTSSIATLLVGSLPIGFDGTGPGWTANQSGAYTSAAITNGLLTLTDGGGSQARSFFFNYPQYIGAFKASFTYRASGNAAADGTTFCLQNDPRGAAAIGGTGGQLGVGTPTPITPSAELELNIYNNSGVGYAFHTNGVTGGYVGIGSVNLKSGDPISISVYYANGQVALTFTDAVAATSFSTNLNVGDLTQVVGGNTAYVGFTGSDGGSTSVQTISNFTFTSIPPAAIQPNGTNLLIYWPGAVAGFVLQQNADLTTTNWVNVAAPSGLTNGFNQVTVPMTDSNLFYRLILPTP